MFRVVKDHLSHAQSYAFGVQKHNFDNPKHISFREKKERGTWKKIDNPLSSNTLQYIFRKAIFCCPWTMTPQCSFSPDTRVKISAPSRRILTIGVATDEHKHYVVFSLYNLNNSATHWLSVMDSYPCRSVFIRCHNELCMKPYRPSQASGLSLAVSLRSWNWRMLSWPTVPRAWRAETRWPLLTLTDRRLQ